MTVKRAPGLLIVNLMIGNYMALVQWSLPELQSYNHVELTRIVLITIIKFVSSNNAKIGA